MLCLTFHSIFTFFALKKQKKEEKIICKIHNENTNKQTNYKTHTWTILTAEAIFVWITVFFKKKQLWMNIEYFCFSLLCLTS